MPSPRYTREIPNRYRLEAARCTGCDKMIFPARRVCPECRGTEFETTQLSRRGKVVTSTVIRVPPPDFLREEPCAIAVVDTP